MGWNFDQLSSQISKCPSAACLPTPGGTHSWIHALVSHFDFFSTGNGINSLTLITCSNIALHRNRRRRLSRIDLMTLAKTFWEWRIYKPLFTHSSLFSSTKLIVYVLNLNSLRARGIGRRDRSGTNQKSIPTWTSFPTL